MFVSPWPGKYKNRNIRLSFKEDIEPQEVLLDRLAQKKEEEAGYSEKKFEVPLLKKILEGLFFFSLALFFLLLAKTFQLQVFEKENLIALAEENKYIWYQIQAERGVIYDRNLEQLAFNQISFDLVCQKNNLPREETEQKRIFDELAKILEIEKEEIEKKIKENEAPEILIRENLDRQSLIILETKIGELSGFQIKNNAVREYPNGYTFAHLIGYKRKTGEKTGLEDSYNSELREIPGEIRTERDAQGNIISQEIISLPKSGKSLVLWLDSGLQKKAVQALENILKTKGKGGAVIALDPKTGGVLSLVSLPSFDNNLFSQGMTKEEWEELDQDPRDPLFNRAISGQYLTGSTIKPLIASAVLEEKIINPDKKINCQGLIEIEHTYEEETTEFHDWWAHGWTDMRKAIAESCNVYFYTVGGGLGEQEGLGPTKIKEYLELFGWQDLTGIDLPGEVKGFVPDKEWKRKTFPEDPGWWDGNTYYLSIGQQYLQITPLEVVNSFLAIANGGKLLQPQVVKEIIDTSTGSPTVIEEMQPKIIRENFISPENLQVVREGMRQAVTGKNSPQASATLLNSLPVAAAAKTGTAELGKNRYHNWVTVFAPYEDPEIILTVMIEDVKNVEVAALPVAKEVLEWYFTKKE